MILKIFIIAMNSFLYWVLSIGKLENENFKLIKREESKNKNATK